MTTRPSFQFYARDWLTCPELRRCSVAARGLWSDLLALAHLGEPYGHLASNGRPYDAAELARLTGCSKAEVVRLLAELERNGVCSRDANSGALFSRRMVRDGAAIERRREGGALGAEHGWKGAEHGARGGRPRSEKPPSKPPSTLDGNHPSKPSPASASASASASAGRSTEPSPTPPRGRGDSNPVSAGQDLAEAFERAEAAHGGVDPASEPPHAPPKRSKRVRIDPATYPLPPALDFPDVRAALVDFNRTRKSGAWEPALADVRLRQLAEWGRERAVAALRHSCGYDGVFEPQGAGGARGVIPSSAPKLNRFHRMLVDEQSKGAPEPAREAQAC